MVVLVLVSGFIAYFGDLLGRKMGKRRLTLFGMRPRYTAIVVTTITGMLIATLTLATMMTISKTLRHVLIAGGRMMAQNERLATKNIQLRIESSKLRIQSKELNARLIIRIAQHRKAMKKLKETELQVTQLSKSIEANLQQLDELKKSRAASEQRLKELESQLNARKEELTATKQELQQRITELDDTEVKLEDVQKKVDEQEDQIAEQLQRIKEAKNIASSYFSMREGNIKFRQGEELTRGVISPGSYFKIRGDLLSLLEEASDIATAQGAKEGENHRAVQLVGAFGIDQEQESLNTWAKSIYARKLESVVVQVTASGNSVLGEQLLVDFRTFRNKLAFKQGATIAETTKPIDGHLSEGKILAQVVGFLQNDVHKAASNAGVIPVANSEPQIKDEQLDELLALMHRVREENSPVEIRAVAERDIWSAGPLNLRSIDFVISPIKTKDK